MTSQQMRYLGCLGLLGECSVYVPEELRECIEQAVEDAEKAGLIRWRRILDPNRSRGCHVKSWYAQLLRTQDTYRTAPVWRQQFMANRALWFSSLCIHTRWEIARSNLWNKHGPFLPAAQSFFLSRYRQPPATWGDIPKARFARVLCGAWTEGDQCRDVLMGRYFPTAQVSAVGQWALWLHRAYAYEHGAQDLLTLEPHIIEDHIRVLRWIRGERMFGIDKFPKMGDTEIRV